MKLAEGFEFQTLQPDRVLVVNKRSRIGLKAQQAHSPGHRPGYVYRREVRPEGAKASEHKRFVSMLLPLQGALHRLNPPKASPWAMSLLPLRGAP